MEMDGTVVCQILTIFSVYFKGAVSSFVSMISLSVIYAPCMKNPGLVFSIRHAVIRTVGGKAS